MNYELKNNVPVIRFPEFKEEWEVKMLGEICEIIGGGTPVSTNTIYWNGTIPWISSSDVTEDNIQDISISRFITEEAVSNSATKIIPINSILIVSRVGVGKFAVSKRELCTSQDFSNLVLKNDDSFFLAYYFSARKSKFLSLSQGTSIKGFTGKDIRNLKFVIPNLLPEQKKIAHFFSTIDQKINQLKEKKNALEHYKKGVMQQIFSLKLRFKDDNGHDFPEWEVKKLGEVCEINPKNKNLPNSFIYVDLESVEKGRLIKKNRISIENSPSRAQRLLSHKDILFQMVRPYQKNNYFFDEKSKDYVASTGYAQIRTNHNPIFIYQLLHTQSFVNKVIVKCTGTGYPAINSTDLSKVIISLPSTREQAKIANFLSKIDEKIANVNHQIEQTKEWKKGLLQQMFCN